MRDFPDAPAITDEDRWASIVAHLNMALDQAGAMQDGRRALGEALCAALETVASGSPRLDAFGDMREDAGWWADCATPAELEVYAAAALRRIERTTFAPAARKRLLVALYTAMTPEDQIAFLGKVDPGGKWTGGG